MQTFQVSECCRVPIWDIERLQIYVLHLRCHTGLFYHLLRLTAYLYNIEYVIVYTSPGSSLLHQVILMSSDGFFIPSGVDLEVSDICLHVTMHSAIAGLTTLLRCAVSPSNRHFWLQPAVEVVEQLPQHS